MTAMHPSPTFRHVTHTINSAMIKTAKIHHVPPLPLTGGEDFVSDPIILSFNENRTSVTANIPIINDAIAEDPETFLVIAEPGSSSLTIVINQADSSLMILDNEGEPPTTYVGKLTSTDDTCHVFAACLLALHSLLHDINTME